MARIDYLTWCQVLLGFWMTKHLYLTTMLLTLHGKGLEKVNVNIVYFLQPTQEYHIWWVTSPWCQNSKDICFVNVRVILWEPDTIQLKWSSGKKETGCCIWTDWVVKKGYECEARTCCSSHWSFQTNYIHAMPKIKWQGNSAIMRFWSTATPHEQKPWNRQFSHIWLVLW